MTHPPFGGSYPAPPTTAPAQNGQIPFGTSGGTHPVQNGQLPFGAPKDGVDLDAALAHLPQPRTYPMPARPSRFEPEFGRWNHYRLPAVDGNSSTAYFPRVTTIGKSLEDTEFLDKWKTGKLLEGVARHPEMLRLIDVDAAAAGDRIQRDLMDKLAERARETVGGSDAGKFGDAVHAWTEVVDEGYATIDDVPIELRGHVAAYINACTAAGLTALPEYVECIVYNPYTGAAGRIDRISRRADGSLVIVDVKTTNNLSSGVLSISVQLAQYATATHILSEDGTAWKPIPAGMIDQEVAIVAHIPSTPDPDLGVICDLVTIDLATGIENMKEAVKVREARSKKRFLNKGITHRAFPHKVLPPIPVTSREPTQMEMYVWEAINNARNAADMADVFAKGIAAGVWEDRFNAWAMHRLHTIGVKNIDPQYHTLHIE